MTYPTLLLLISCGACIGFGVRLGWELLPVVESAFGYLITLPGRSLLYALRLRKRV